MAAHSSVLAWRIPGTGKPGGLLSMRSLRVGHDWVTSLSLFTFMHWRGKWQPTPVFLPGESQGRGSLVGCRLWGCRVGHDWSDAAAAALTLWITSAHKLPFVSYSCWKRLQGGSASSRPTLGPDWTRALGKVVSWVEGKWKWLSRVGLFRPHGLYNPWNSLGQNTGVGSLFLLRGIFLTQGSNPGLPHCGRILHQLSHQGRPSGWRLEWRGSAQTEDDSRCLIPVTLRSPD